MEMVDSAEKYDTHGGHRARMRAKLLSHGQKIFDTYELLEMLLYYVIPYKDTNPIAKRLLAKFGGIDGVFEADHAELTSVSGVGNATADFLKKMAAFDIMLSIQIPQRDSCEFSDYCAVGEYLVNYFAGSEDFSVIAMFFDNNMRLLGIEKMYDVDYSSGGIKGGKFLDAAIRKSASVVITAHYHPHGPFFPTPGDRATDRVVSETLDMAGILHAEHYIVCGENYAGISSVKNFTRKFSQYPAIDSFINSRTASISTTYDAEAVMNSSMQNNQRDSDYDEGINSYFDSLFLTAFPNRANLAERTFKKYRTIEGAMTTPVFDLITFEDEGFACFIKLLAYISSRRVTDGYKLNGKAVYSVAELCTYLKALYLGQASEVAYLLCFDGEGRFIDSEIIGEGTVNSTNVLPRKALEIAIEKSAKRVALAHNHPLGNTEASSDDVRMTNVMAMAFGACEIKLEGHYIVAGQYCSVLNLHKQ